MVVIWRWIPLLLKSSLITFTGHKNPNMHIQWEPNGPRRVSACPTNTRSNAKWQLTMWLLPASQNFHLLKSPKNFQPSTAVNKPWIIELAGCRSWYVCICLEDKIVKQMGSTVAYRNPAHMPLRKRLELLYLQCCSSLVLAHGRRGEKSVFLVRVFASVFPSVLVWNNLLNETQLVGLCKNQSTGFLLRSQFSLLMPMSCLQKKMGITIFLPSPPTSLCFHLPETFQTPALIS